MKGGYLLILENEKDRVIRVGNREILFKKGFYIYCGSGMTNLEKRVERHFFTNKRLRWNVDYISVEMKPKLAFLIASDRRIECELSRVVGEMYDAVDGFGASDCRCNTHLYRTDQDPISRLEGLLKTKLHFTEVKILKKPEGN